MYWRSPAYNLTRLAMTTLIALFYGTMYLQKGHLPTTGLFFFLSCHALGTDPKFVFRVDFSRLC